MARGTTFTLNSGSDLYTGLVNALCGSSPANLSMVDSVSADNVTITGSGATGVWSDDATLGRKIITISSATAVGTFGSSISLGTIHSVSWWMKSSQTSGTIAIFGNYNTTAPYIGVFGAKIYYYADGTHYVSVTYTPSDGAWHHYCVTRSGATVKFYVDGSQQGTTQTLSDGTITDTISILGNANYLVAGTSNKLTDWLMWTAQLSDAQVARVAGTAAGSSGEYDPTVGGLVVWTPTATASFTSSTTSTITMACTAPAGTVGTVTYQWQRSANASTWSDISGATSYSSVTDTPTAQVLPYAYRLKFVDNNGTWYSNVVWGALQQPAINIGWIGDSEWGSIVATPGPAATNSVVDMATAMLTAINGPRVVSGVQPWTTCGATDMSLSSTYTNHSGQAPRATKVYNWALSNQSTTSWLPTDGDGYLTNALIDFAYNGVTHVMIMLGTNDAYNATSAATYKSNLQAIIAAILAAGMKVILNYPGNTWTDAAQPLMMAYWAKIDSLIDGVNVLLGDTEFPQWCANNRTQFNGNAAYAVHPNLDGQFTLGFLHAQAVSRILDKKPVHATIGGRVFTRA